MPELRMALIECRSCRFWTGKGATAGECRRFPPIQSNIEGDQIFSAAHPQWPPTNAEDWCGEWQALAEMPTRGES